VSTGASYGLASYAKLSGRAAYGLARAGALAPVSPRTLVRMARALSGGVTAATACALSAARYPTRAAIIDEQGILTFAALDARVSALADGLAEHVEPGGASTIAIMCRNHRGFVQALLAAAKLGSDVLLLNTEFPGPQLKQALESHTVGAAVLDEEFLPSFDAAGYQGARVIAWHERTDHALTLDGLVSRKAKRTTKPARAGRIIILTSGTTGAPKGAPRTPTLRALLGPLATLLSELPLRAGEPLFVAPPLFHAFGLAYLSLGLFLGSPVLVRRKFDPREAARAIVQHRVSAVVGVPVMLQRMLEVPEAELRALRQGSLRAVISAGAPLSGALSQRLMDALGDVLYNLYGSTETGFGAIAGPADLRSAPGTVGRPPFGTELKILRADRSEAPQGHTGAIFLGGPLVFEGYSGGGNKETVRGLMNTGDLGHLDHAGRLFVDGREDDMIVSGGENVFPGEIEELLVRHEGVADAAVLGVRDEEFGQRLAAFVVPRAAQAPSADALRAYLKLHVARYKLPREFVFMDELPRNATGKVLRKKLLPT
jgi:acyl-CoA synthetase (AMP-forming)/AMP-acid ligase II